MSSILSMIPKMASPCVQAAVICRRQISTTSQLFAVPPRKKKRLDPAVLRTRVEKKIKKTEREINRLEKEPKQLIPILEYSLTNSQIRDLNARPGRTLADAGLDEATWRAANRLWGFYRLEQSRMEAISMKKVVKAQENALDTLKKIDGTLYNATTSVDELTLIPYISSHMRKDTGPNPDYEPPDGYIKDVSKEWVM